MNEEDEEEEEEAVRGSQGIRDVVETQGEEEGREREREWCT